MSQKIFLPGLDKQFYFFEKEVELDEKRILILGSFSEQIALNIIKKYNADVEIIVEDYDSLINSKLVIYESENVMVKLMDFEVTDYDENEFDVIYAQASISNTRRNKIVKEIKRILKPDGILCVGEITKKTENPPTFVLDIFENSELEPLQDIHYKSYYEERKFQLLKEIDVSSSLEAYYEQSFTKLKDSKEELTEDEQKYYKKLLKKVSHESQAYLKQGADKFIGMNVYLLKLSK